MVAVVVKEEEEEGEEEEEVGGGREALREVVREEVVGVPLIGDRETGTDF